MADAAAKMSGTTVDHKLVGSAWPGHFNKVIAETQQKNIEQVGMPKWSEADQTLAKALQKEIGAKVEGLSEKVEATQRAGKESDRGWFRRRRRHFLECSDGVHVLPGEHSESAGA